MREQMRSFIKSRRRQLKMFHSWQPVGLIMGALVLSFALASVSARESKPKATSLSYSQTSHGLRDGALSLISSRGYQEPLSAATKNDDLDRVHADEASSQANIHLSIIDRLNAAPSLPAASINHAATTNAYGDLQTAAGGHHHHGYDYGKYYEYREVPAPDTWKFGYRRGNHKHTIERHEYGQAGKYPHFKTQVKWHDAEYGGKGYHLWDYNHHDDKHYHHY